MKSLGSVVLLAAAGLALVSSAPPIPERSAESAAVRADRIRLRQHFVEVLSHLRAADVSRLSPAQREARARALEHLETYRRAERFPHNHDVLDRRVPYFQDRHGTLCAMAYLIAESGHGALVELVRDRLNNGRIDELARDPIIGPPLAAWLDEHGMTAEEAALVQPTYDPPLNPSAGGCDSEICVTTGYAVASTITGAVELTASAFNSGLVGSSGARRWTAPLGIVSGLFGIRLGVEYFDRERGALTLGIANAGVGALSTALGVAALLSGGDPQLSALRVGSSTVAPFVGPVTDRGQPIGIRISF